MFQMQLLNKCDRRRASIIPVSILNKSHLVTNVKMRLIQCKSSRNILYKMQLLNKCNRRRASIIPVSILNKCHLVTNVKMTLIQCKNSQNIFKMQLLNECNYMYLFSYLKNWDVYDCIVYSIVACAAFAQDDTYSV